MAEIAESVVFCAKETGRAVIVVASGDNRVSEKKAAKLVGEPLGRADADLVREATGFVIGGVSPGSWCTGTDTRISKGDSYAGISCARNKGVSPCNSLWCGAPFHA